uniref:Olfactory receptor 125 n=1 Tax=Aulacocentrum confusum TaxID=2767324 RepID=A0A7G8Z9E4_9HYME|nr:olfactory receptor 125 [Aulacocentrum confusum]
MFLVCAQVNILKHRFYIMIKNLEKIVKDEQQPEKLEEYERQLIGDWVRYHTLIISLSNFMHSKFSKVVFIQYSVSAVIICTTIYIMTNIPVASVEFAGNLLYVVGETFGIFIECVSANEATLEVGENFNYFTAFYFSLYKLV